KNRKPDTKPSRELAAYASVYDEPAYGRATVSADKDGLTIRWGRLTFRLAHYHFDSFTGRVSAPANDAIANERAYFDMQFRLGTNGDVEGLRFLDQEFKRTKGGATFDLLIRGGLVYDGTGKSPRRADVGIRGDKIAAIGDLSAATAKSEIDAKGL